MYRSNDHNHPAHEVIREAATSTTDALKPVRSGLPNEAAVRNFYKMSNSFIIMRMDNGHKYLCERGFVYYRASGGAVYWRPDGQKAHRPVYWECQDRYKGCPAGLKTNDEEIVSRSHEHNHLADEVIPEAATTTTERSGSPNKVNQTDERSSLGRILQEPIATAVHGSSMGTLIEGTRAHMDFITYAQMLDRTEANAEGEWLDDPQINFEINIVTTENDNPIMPDESKYNTHPEITGEETGAFFKNK